MRPVRGLPAFDIVGLPDAAVKEAGGAGPGGHQKQRLLFPRGADHRQPGPGQPEEGGHGVRPAHSGRDSGRRRPAHLVRPQLRLCGGALSLSGSLRPVVGMLPMALAAKKAGIQRLYVPAENAPEATLAQGLAVYPVETVEQLAAHLAGREPISPRPPGRGALEELPCPDFSEVRGQEQVKRVLEIAAAGGHNAAMIGPPGSGKSMLARRLPSILPLMTRREALEATQIHSVMGLTSKEHPCSPSGPSGPPTTPSPPWAWPGAATPTPGRGEISLAHNGVLFLDELPEFHSDVLEVLRQPMEEGRSPWSARRPPRLTPAALCWCAP